MTSEEISRQFELTRKQLTAFVKENNIERPSDWRSRAGRKGATSLIRKNYGNNKAI